MKPPFRSKPTGPPKQRFGRVPIDDLVRLAKQVETLKAQLVRGASRELMTSALGRIEVGLRNVVVRMLRKPREDRRGKVTGTMAALNSMGGTPINRQAAGVARLTTVRKPSR